MLLQITTDHTGCFIDVEVRHSGHNHDVNVFKQTTLCAVMNASSFISGNPCIMIEGIPPLIIADLTYPLHEWVMKPYGGHGDAHPQRFECCGMHFWDAQGTGRCLTTKLAVA